MQELPFMLLDNGRRGQILVQKAYFERDCILRVVSEYTHAYFISFYPAGDESLEISISARDGSLIDESLLRTFFNHCIDEQIRIDLQKEFGTLRQCIVEYAFRSVEKGRV